MTIVDLDLTDGDGVTASLVPDKERLGTLPRVFGSQLIRAEALVYRWMQGLCPAYVGGYWHFHWLSNGGFYMAPSGGPERVPVQVTANGYLGSMSWDAAGITACLFAFNQLANQHGREQDRFIDLFHWLRDFATSHTEASDIFSAID